MCIRDSLGNGHLAATNFYIQRVRILDGQTDGFYFIHSNYFSGTIRDCIVNAKWDAYVQSTPALGTCTNYVEIWNSSFTIDHTNTVFTSAIGADMHPIRVSNGTLVLNNCDLVCTNGKSATALVMGGTRGTTIYLNQSRVNVAGTNGAGTYYKFDNALLPVTWNLVANSSGILDADGKPGSIATFLNAGFASITATNTVTVTNYDGSYTYISSQGAFGDNAGQWQVGNFNGPLLQFLTSGNTVRPTGTPYPSLGDSTRPYDGIFATNITTKKTITLGGITASRALMVNASGNVTNVTSSDPANEFVHADGTTGTASGGFTVGSFIQVSGVSNHVENTFSASSVNTLYGTNQMWRTYATSNLTYAVSGLRSNVLYWMLHTNNTSTITVPATWQWPFEPNYAAPSMTGGRYIVILLLNDQGTNAWLQEAPTFQLVPGQNMVFTTNAATATVTVSTSLTPTFTTSTLTNGLILMATNANVALLRVANSNAAPVTNILGFLEKASGSPIICDANDGNNFFLTNRVTAATTIVSTNTAPGQEMTFLVIGEASGGSARTITFIPKLGNLVANLDVFGTALAVSSTGFSFSLTNGNAVEVSERIVRLNGTNMSLFISRQFAF